MAAGGSLTPELLTLLKCVFGALRATKASPNVLTFLTRLERAWKQACAQNPTLDASFIKMYCVDALNRRPKENPLLRLVRWLLEASSLLGCDSELSNASVIVLGCDSFAEFLADFAEVPPHKSLQEVVEATFHSSGTVVEAAVMADVDCEALLRKLQQQAWYRSQMILHEDEAKGAQSEPMRNFHVLTPPSQAALRELFPHCVGSPALYIHQAQALDALLEGDNVSLSTSTASGKSLVFITFGVDCLIRRPEGTVLVVYPTKALAQNQLLKWREHVDSVVRAGAAPISANVIDGDTDYAQRRQIILESRILLSNFDFIHKTMALWKQLDFVRRLVFVAIDEAHVCRGIFGAHSALTLRRLFLLNRFLQQRHWRIHNPVTPQTLATIQLVIASATLGNPADHFRRLTGRECTAITTDGSPNAQRFLILWRPDTKAPAGPQTGPTLWRPTTAPTPADPALAALDTSRSAYYSAIQDAVRLFAFFVNYNVRTFLFCNSRSLVELLFTEAQQSCKRIMNYRGGFVKEYRRELESKIFKNEVVGVVTTNALELGIDLGLLDVVITLGFEGSLSSVKQRLGRAGRSDNRPSIGILVAFDSPVEHYICSILKERFWLRPPEVVGLSVENVLVLKQHLLCALQEIGLPIHRDVLVRIFGEAVLQALAVALRTGEARQVVQEPYFKFVATSMNLLMNDGLEEQESIASDALSDDGEDEADCETAPVNSSETPSAGEPRSSKQVFSFIEHSEREAEPGLSQTDLEHIVEQSEVKALKVAGIMDQGPDRPTLTIQDIETSMKSVNCSAFTDPHQLVDLRATVIPNVSVYIVSATTVEGGVKRREVRNTGPGAATMQMVGSASENTSKGSEGPVRGAALVDEVELMISFLTLFPGAVYIHHGVKYLVKEFNPVRLFAVLEKPREVVNYYTKSGDSTVWRLKVISKKLTFSRSSGVVTAHGYCGDVKIILSVPHYHKVKTRKGGGQELEKCFLSLPDLTLVTRGLCLRLHSQRAWRLYNNACSTATGATNVGFVPQAALNMIRKGLDRSMSGLGPTYWPAFATHGLGHLLVKLLVTTVWCDVKEIGCNCVGDYTAQLKHGRPLVYVFEKPASVSLGIADAITDKILAQLLTQALEACRSCSCSENEELDGCLDCVLLPSCATQNRVVSHAATRLLLEIIIQGK